MRFDIEAVNIPPLDVAAIDAMLSRRESLVRPRGSLGRLEEIAVRLAGIGISADSPIRPGIVVFAADHGIVRHGVSMFQQQVTGEMLSVFDRGGGTINVFASLLGADLRIVNVGTIDPQRNFGTVSNVAVGSGTADFTEGPAMTRDQAVAAIGVGATAVDEEVEKGIDVIALGEMGIGNTTAAAAITSVVCSSDSTVTTGFGTGITIPMLARKREIVERGIERNKATLTDPLGILCALGGFEIAALVGAILRGAERRAAIVVDGVTVGAAALIADLVAPRVREFMFAGHLSVEPSHGLQLARLGLAPLLTLEMRLGEGTGAALATTILRAAWLSYTRVETFDTGGVRPPAP